MLRASRSVPSLLAQLSLACGLLWLGILPNDGSGTACAQQPNVVLFLADDMGWTDWQNDAVLNPTGSVVYETPNLLRLAQESVNFRNAYASAPICSPTRTSILTGKAPARHRMTNYLPGLPDQTTPNLKQPPNWQQALPAADVTLAESMKAGGYATAFFGKWHLGPNGTPHANPASAQNGFETNVGGTHFSSPPLPDGYFAGSDGRWAGMPGLDTMGQFPTDKYLTDALSEKAADYIGEKAGAGEPFFMSFWDYAPHIPIQAPAALVSKYQNKIAELQGMGVDLKGHTNPTYAAMIEKMDEGLGRLLDRLENPDGDLNTADSIRDNTIFIFTSDNGGTVSLDAQPMIPTRNLPLREGKGSMYEGGIREPLMVSWTGNSDFEQSSFSDAQTVSHDLYPTLLDLTGLLDDPLVPKNVVIDGVTIRDALEGNAFDRGRMYFHYPHRSNQDTSSANINGGAFVSAVIDDDWKLIFYYEDRHYELYNLEADIGETTNLLTSNPGLAHELSQALNGYLVSVSALMPINRVGPDMDLPVAPPTVLTAPIAGDYNGDGFVTMLDYQTWKTNYGSTTLLAADGNGNRIVDAADYTVWRNLLSAGAGAIVGGGELPTGVVPEPASLALFVLGGIFCAVNSVRRRTRTRRPSAFRS